MGGGTATGMAGGYAERDIMSGYEPHREGAGDQTGGPESLHDLREGYGQPVYDKDLHVPGWTSVLPEGGNARIWVRAADAVEELPPLPDSQAQRLANKLNSQFFRIDPERPS